MIAIEKNIVIFETQDGGVQLPVNIENETVWLNRTQMADLFGRDVKTTGKHINNALNEELQGDNSTVANFATVQKEGERIVERQIEHYSLDVIISVGYRVKSRRGVEFRKWANQVLRDYIVKGYAVNNNRINQLNEVVRIMKRIENQLDAKQVLSVVEQYSTALDLLDAYDHQKLLKPKGNKSIYVLTYEECRSVIGTMNYGESSDLFGKEKDQSFTDGNKRIAAAIFLYFLDKNGVLFSEGNKMIDDYTLVALTIMIAESRPEEKEMMISIIMNCLAK